MSKMSNAVPERVTPSENSKRPPMKLPVLIALGLIGSLVALGAFVWLFAWYETGDGWPMDNTPRLSQNKWFEVVRNAVTAAAAVGVGVTLVLSYRRQRTAEETQRIGAEAQRTAAEAQKTAADALELSNRQHELDQHRRRDAVTSELRARYSQAAEQLGSSQLPVRLAGIYSLAALADDWADAGNADERQVCIDLLSAYVRSASPEEGPGDRSEVVQAIFDVAVARLKRDTPERKFWGRNKIELRRLPSMPPIDGLIIADKGFFTLEAKNLTTPNTAVSNVEMTKSAFVVFQVREGRSGEEFTLDNSRLAGGNLILNFRGRDVPSEEPVPSRLTIRRVTLAGAWLKTIGSGWDIVFDDCAFKSGELSIAAGSGSVTFRDCLFEADVFGNKFRRVKRADIEAASMTIENCRFENDAIVLESSGSAGKT